MPSSSFSSSATAELRRVEAVVRRALVRRRRLVAALLAGAAVLVGLRALAPAPPPSAFVTIAARDLAAGARLGADDVRTVRVARELAPTSGAVVASAAIGQVLAGPLRAGQVITDRSVVGPPLLGGYPSGTVASPIRLGDADVAALLSAGDHIDVYAAVADVGQPAALVAADVTVITTPEVSDDAREGGAVVLVAATPDQSARLAGAAATSDLAIDIRPP